MLEEESVVLRDAIFLELLWSGYDPVGHGLMYFIIDPLREDFGDASDENADKSKEQENDKEDDKKDEKKSLIVFAEGKFYVMSHSSSPPSVTFTSIILLGSVSGAGSE